MLSILFFVVPFLPVPVLAYTTTCSGNYAPSQPHFPVCNGPPGVYAVRPSRGKGLGVFAAHDLDVGDIIMREAPIIKISLPKLSRGSPYPMAAVSKLVQDEFELLSSNAQGEVMALTHYTDPARSAQPDILGTIFRTNAYNTGDKVALFPRIARINHSCRPNSGYYWSEKLNRRIVFVTRKVKAGEEFFVSYISLLLSQEDRQKQLDRYGFKCQCEACTQERAAREASDHRRATIKRAFANFEYQLDLAPPASDAERGYARKGAEASAQLAQLVQAEGLADYYAKAYRIAAISHARLEDWEAAAVWANKGFEIRYMEDPESPSTMEMQQLTTTFISNWQNHLQQRSST